MSEDELNRQRFQDEDKQLSKKHSPAKEGPSENWPTHDAILEKLSREIAAEEEKKIQKRIDDAVSEAVAKVEEERDRAVEELASYTGLDGPEAEGCPNCIKVESREDEYRKALVCAADELDAMKKLLQPEEGTSTVACYLREVLAAHEAPKKGSAKGYGKLPTIDFKCCPHGVAVTTSCSWCENDVVERCAKLMDRRREHLIELSESDDLTDYGKGELTALELYAMKIRASAKKSSVPNIKSGRNPLTLGDETCFCGSKHMGPCRHDGS